MARCCCLLFVVQVVCNAFAGLLQAERAGLEVCREYTRTDVGLKYNKYDSLLICRCCVIDLGCFCESGFPTFLALVSVKLADAGRRSNVLRYDVLLSLIPANCQVCRVSVVA
jgi:hypothetical protein